MGPTRGKSLSSSPLTVLNWRVKLPLFGWLVGMVGGLFCALCWFIGIINAIQGVEKEVPLLGQIKIL